MGRKPKVSRVPLTKGNRTKVKRERDALIRYNAELIEELFASEVYLDILKPILDESIASVDGKQLGSKWYFGEFSKSASSERLQFLRGYSLALKEFTNRLVSFVEAKHGLQAKKEEERAEIKQPLINPFLEELNEWQSVNTNLFEGK